MHLGCGFEGRHKTLLSDRTMVTQL